MSMEPEVPPQEDMKTTMMWTGGALAVAAVLFALVL